MSTARDELHVHVNDDWDVDSLGAHSETGAQVYITGFCASRGGVSV